MLVPDLTVCCEADYIIIVMMAPTGLRAWRDAKMAHPRLGRIHHFSYVGFGFPDWRGIFRQGLTDGGRWIVWQSFIGIFALDSQPVVRVFTYIYFVMAKTGRVVKGQTGGQHAHVFASITIL